MWALAARSVPDGFQRHAAQLQVLGFVDFAHAAAPDKAHDTEAVEKQFVRRERKAIPSGKEEF